MTTRHQTWPHTLPAPDPRGDTPHVWLRLLQTSDIHAHLMAFDYDRRAEVPHYGLARTATLIEHARTEAPNTLLFDNGDFLQGTVLSDVTTGPEAAWPGPHPVIAAMNRLNYAAACLGNHEFNFGLDWLTRVLEQADFPVVCANAFLTDGGNATDGNRTLVPPSLLLPCRLTDTLGHPHEIKIGVLGLLPPQITTWDYVHLDGRVRTEGIVDTALREVPRLRAAGADLVIALAHTGMSDDPCPADTPLEASDPDQENAALQLARIPGLDAVLAGHSHQIFPDPDSTTPIEGVSHEAGTLAGTPAVMAGYRGSHLGVIDLGLQATETGWQVLSSHSVARPVQAGPDGREAAQHPAILESVKAAHDATLKLTAHPVGHTARPLHSFLAQVLPCRTVEPVLMAKRAALTKALRGTKHQDLPVLAATAPFKTGGLGGAVHYVDIPEGPLTLGNLAELYPFPNTMIGLRLPGAKIADWLERAASCFHQILPDLNGQPQPLWNKAFPGHAFDTVMGISYRIDLSQPPRYDAQGTCINPDSHRIRDLTFQGAPIAPEAEFAVATNNFRAFGGGPYMKAPSARIIHEGDTPVRDLLARHLQHSGPIAATPPSGTWHLTGPSDAVLMLETGPGIRNHPDDLVALSARALGTDPLGFVRLAIPLAALAPSCESCAKPLNDPREVGAGRRLANPVRSGRKQP